jgi:transcriptional regulator with XRE-family HTH domain
MNTEASYSQFGETLRKIRRQKGYSLAQLAELCGISKRMIGHYETQVKRPSVDKLTKIAEALGVGIDELLETTKVPKKQKDDIPHKIMKKIRLIEKLPVRDQKMIFSMINSLIENNKAKGKL